MGRLEAVRRLVKKGDYSLAAEGYRGIIGLDPDNAGLHEEFAGVLSEKGDRKEALAEYMKAIGMGRETVTACMGIARIYAEDGEYGKAEEACLKALKFNPSDADVRGRLGIIYEKTGRYDPAEEELRKALSSEEGEKCGEFHACLGRVYEKKGDFKQAVKELEEAYGCGYEKPDVFNDLGRLYAELGDYDSSIINLKKAVSAAPADGKYNAEMGFIYNRLGDGLSAKNHMERALEKGYDDERLRLELADLYMASGDREKAGAGLRKVMGMKRCTEEVWFGNKVKNHIEALEGKSLLESRPGLLAVHLTSRCNIRCIMCSNWKESAWDIPRRTCEEAAGWFPYLEKVSWSGGEPLLSEHFDRLFDEASVYPQLRQEVTTNGLLIDEERAGRLTSSPADIMFSIDSINRDGYERIRKGAEFGRLIKSIELVNRYRYCRSHGERRVNTGIHFLLMRSNYRELGDVIAFMERYGFNKLRIIKLEGDFGENLFLDPDAKELEYVRKSLDELSLRARESAIEYTSTVCFPRGMGKDPSAVTAGDGGTPGKAGYGMCLYPWIGMIIEVGGNVIPWCYCREAAGNVAKMSLEDIWNGRVMQEYRLQMAGKESIRYCDAGCLETSARRRMLL